MAEATTAEPTLDQQLESLLGEQKSTEVAPKAEQKSEGEVKPTEAKSGETATTEDPLEKELEAIKEEPKEDEPAKPALTTEQSSILAAIPTAEVATQLYTTVENYNNFTGAFEAGKFDDVDKMFQNWNPEAYEAFLDHVYSKKVATGEWVDRFIAEQEGGGKTHKGMQNLEKKIAQLQAQISQRDQGQQQTQAQQREQQAFTAYTQHVETLFEQIKFSAADRRWVTADLNARVAANPKVLAALKSGNVTAANGLFKEAVRDYVNRDKQTTDATGAKIAAQSAKKPPVGGGVSTQETGQLPDDIRAVPKGQEDTWMDQQFEKLKRLVKK